MNEVYTQKEENFHFFDIELSQGDITAMEKDRHENFIT